MSRFRSIDRDTDFLLPPSVQEWLPEAHLARYVAAVVEGLDLSEIERAYAGRGSDAYHPATLLSLLIYGYATGTFSSRKIERATYDSLAFRYLACNRHPDHDTLATFRRRFGKQFESSFVHVLQIAYDNQLSSFGTVSFDGTKIHANASRHSALSYEHAVKLEAQLKAEVQELFVLAEAADKADVPDGMSVPDEIARREDQIKAIAQAKEKIEARAKVRYAREKAEFDAKVAAREAKEAETGKKLGGRKPTAPTDSPRAEDQINLTDDESRIMKVAGGGFEQCYNAQAVVDTESMLVVVPYITQATNDKLQIEHALTMIAALPEGMNAPKNALVKQYQRFFQMEGCELDFTPGSLQLVAERALKRDTGARALRSVMEEIMLELMYQLPDLQQRGKYIISEDVVRGEVGLFDRKPIPIKESA